MTKSRMVLHPDIHLKTFNITGKSGKFEWGIKQEMSISKLWKVMFG